MDRNKMSETKLDMLFGIFGVCIKPHEVNCYIDSITPHSLRCIPFRKDIEIEMFKIRKEVYLSGSYDRDDMLREVFGLLDRIDKNESFIISSERWPILTQRREFIRKLEWRAIEFLRHFGSLPDFKRFEIIEYNFEHDCGHQIRIYVGDKVMQYSLNREALGHGYYSRLVITLLYLFEQALEVQEEIINIEREKTFIREQINGFFGLPAYFDTDGDKVIVMQRGRGLSKSLAQIKALNDLRKNGVSKIQIAPGKKLENLHEDILDSFRYLYDFGFMNDCTARAIVRYCEADAKATMEAALAMKENNKQVVLEQLEEEDPQVPMMIFESLVTDSSNGEPEILIGADISNKEDKTMMIPVVRRPEIKEIIFNEPATIVFWKDGTKTIVKCGEGEKYDPEKGVAIALAKKMLYSKDYSRVIASGDDWKRIKAERRKTEAKKRAAAKKKALKKAEAEKAKKAPAKKKPMPKLPVNANVTKTSTVKKTAKRTK